MKSRMEVLEEMVTQDPANSFARYGLAQEYAGSGRLEDAIAEFRRLMEQNPNYSAAYYHAGRALEKLGRVDEARETYRAGVEACHRIGDQHALSEMEAALHELG